MDITGDEESFVEEESPWDPNPDLVSFEFVKTGKSKGDGILTTNDNNFKVLTQLIVFVILTMQYFNNRLKRNLLQSPNLW